MKIGFSSLVCPGWGLDALITQASSLGFDGVELRGLRGELHLPLAPELAARPDQVRKMLDEKKVQLTCLVGSAILSSRTARKVAEQKALLTETVELAGRLGCPYVRLFAGEVEKRDHQRAALARIAAALSAMAPIAARWGVTLVLENGGDFPGSQELWFLIDAVDHPSVRACWNQSYALTTGERPTVSIPRLGNKIGLVHLCDATYDSQGVLLDYQPLGEGQGEVERQIELLKGLAYDRFVIFEWPKLWVPSLPEPESVLPAAVKRLREWINAKQAVLSAYKGDKNAPKFARRAATPANSA
jgi:sugar phosphate isomerase/epimerase